MSDAVDAFQTAEEVARASYGRLVALIARSTHDIAAAEDAVGDALIAAVERWPVDGVPDRPEAWLLTTARRKVIGSLRRADTATRNRLELQRIRDELDEPDETSVIPDRRLELMYACAHPAIDRSIRSPLMLQTVLGLDAARIASAFAVAPKTMGQRLSRAKSKIRVAGVPFEIPAHPDDLAPRTLSVLDAIYAAFGTGWDDPAGTDPTRRGLTLEAIRLAQIVVALLPDDAEARGLLAMMLHSEARRPARRGPDGGFVPLADQDVALWSADLMYEAEQHVTLAAARRELGPFQLQAAIQSIHNRRAMTGLTDWASIAALYDGLVALEPSMGALVARAAAHSEVEGPRTGLALLDEIDLSTVASYQPYWVTRAHLLAAEGDLAGARDATVRAIGLTTDPAVRRHLISSLPS